MFISFEGPEGSGKSLQARMLAARLRNVGLSVLETREPGGTLLGDEVRHLLLNRDEVAPTSRAEALLMNASRAQLVEKVIRPALEQGNVVVCDRFADSTLAYQGVGRGLAMAELASVISFATAGLQPEMTLLLDVPVEVGLARKHAQEQRNRFEAEAVAFHTRVREAYLRMAAASPSRWRVLDGRLPAETLSSEIWSVVAALLGRVR